MARLQILELPTEHHGDDMVTPFVLVVDQSMPQRIALGADVPYADYWQSLADGIGARGVIVTPETVEIPANDYAPDDPPRIVDFAELEEAKRLTEQRDEARQWARHGYEIGQRHCSWTDYGVAPDWLTDGWPNSFDSCEHLKRAAELEETIARVRAVSTTPEVMNADQERTDVWLHGYKVGVLAAKGALRPRNEPTEKS